MDYTPSIIFCVDFFLLFLEEFYEFSIKLIERFSFLLILQVLVNFSEEAENESDGQMYAQSGSNNVSNIHSSMDTIHMETFWSSILLTLRCLSHLFTSILNLLLNTCFPRVSYILYPRNALIERIHHRDFCDSFNFFRSRCNALYAVGRAIRALDARCRHQRQQVLTD